MLKVISGFTSTICHGKRHFLFLSITLNENKSPSDDSRSESHSVIFFKFFNPVDCLSQASCILAHRRRTSEQRTEAGPACLLNLLSRWLSFDRSFSRLQLSNCASAVDSVTWCKGYRLRWRSDIWRTDRGVAEVRSPDIRPATEHDIRHNAPGLLETVDQLLRTKVRRKLLNQNKPSRLTSYALQQHKAKSAKLAASQFSFLLAGFETL